MVQPAYPLVVVEGSPFERGSQHGEQAAERVARSIDVHRRAIKHFSGIEWAEAVSTATTYAPVLESYAPQMLEELHGIAEGSRQAFADILALNVRAELTFTPQMAQGCTSFAVLPEATSDGHTYVGQSWDNLAALMDACIVLKVRRQGLPSYLTITEAGAPAMVGLNDAGIGIVRNALVATSAPGPIGVPMNAVHYQVLAANGYGDAVGALFARRLATPWFYLIGAPGEAIGFEAAPEIDQIHDSGGLLTHSNHFLSARLHVEDLGRRALPDTVFRHRRLQRFLEAKRGRLNAATILEGFQDHFNYPNSLCRHPDERVPVAGRMATVFAVVMDLDERVMHLCDGPPCKNQPRAIGVL